VLGEELHIPGPRTERRDAQVDDVEAASASKETQRMLTLAFSWLTLSTSASEYAFPFERQMSATMVASVCPIAVWSRMALRSSSAAA
jgi:hypothetical protein